METESYLSIEFVDRHPSDAARVLEGLQTNETAAFLEAAPVDTVAKVMTVMDSMSISGCFEIMQPGSIGRILEKLPLSIASLSLRRIEKPALKAILEASAPEVARHISRLLKYPVRSCGSVMSADIVVLHQDVSVREALTKVRRYAEKFFYDIYIIDRDHVLVGSVSMRDLMLSGEETHLGAMMNRNLKPLSPYSDYESILASPAWLEYDTLPVVDEKGVLLGALSYRQLRRMVGERETGEGESLTVTGKALGELYWIGVSGLMRGVASAVSRGKAEPRDSPSHKTSSKNGVKENE